MNIRIPMSHDYSMSLKAYNSIMYPDNSPKKYGEYLSNKNHGRSSKRKRRNAK